MNARERLQAARTATLEGRYKDALRDCVWFHEHALEEDQSFYGVRLSFALSYWMELAEVHPPALDSFRSIRDAKAALLRQGEGNRDLFHDVESMNDALGQHGETADLFVLLDEQNGDLAKQCSRLAFPALVKAARFGLASKYLPPPLPYALGMATDLCRDIEEIGTRPRSKDPRYRAFIQIFATDLQLLRDALRGSHRLDEANDVVSHALKAVKPIQVRRAVAKVLAVEATLGKEPGPFRSATPAGTGSG